MRETYNYESGVLTDNYLYISHLDVTSEDEKYIWLPAYPDQVSDSMGSKFNDTNALGRSAPVYTYSSSGPREVKFSLVLHRDLMDEANVGKSNAQLKPGEDYVDYVIRALQSIAVPKYNITDKVVEPPWVALRLSNQIFIRGVVTGQVGVEYRKPLLNNGKYAMITISFIIYETDPYDASSIFTNGSFRGVTRALKKGFNLED